MRITGLLCGVALLTAFVGCSGAVAPVGADGARAGSGDGEEKGAGGGSMGSPGGGDAASGGASVPTTAPTDGAGGGTSGGTSGSTSGSGEGTGQVPAGTLTAGTWDDNRNFERFLGYRAGVLESHPTGILPFTEADHRAANTLFSTITGARTKLDISLVVDTTGSMGDEIVYLQTEFDALAASIQTKYPNAEQRWSLVVYKDTQDEYVTRWFDFRRDTADFRTHLAAQSAGGGGDFPESPEKGFERANALAWRGNDTAKLAFWVADAPHHDDRAQAMASAIAGAKTLGVHIYPVASSGVDEFTELTMRTAAQMTGGRYIYLTNDSGVGGAHKEPSVPCYFVTKLDRAILRMVDIEMTGTYREPDAADILRTGGDPQNGICKLESGPPATIF